MKKALTKHALRFLDNLKLEIDKGLHLAADELVDAEHRNDHGGRHRRQWKAGKAFAVSLLALLRNPVDQVADRDDRKHHPIAPDDLEDQLKSEMVGDAVENHVDSVKAVAPEKDPGEADKAQGYQHTKCLNGK